MPGSIKSRGRFLKATYKTVKNLFVFEEYVDNHVKDIDALS